MKAGQSPLHRAFASKLTLLSTTLQAATAYQYRRAARLFLEFLGDKYPGVTRPSQLERDPHILGWLEDLCGYRHKGRPLDSSTRGAHVMHLRVLLESMEDLPQPPKPGLLRAADVPKRRFPLPRPLTPEDDERLFRYWETATGTLDSALYLMRLTGIRIGECADLSPDCLLHCGDNRWVLHVPHGKPRGERMVPVEDRARQLVERLGFLRTLPPAADPRFLLARPAGRQTLMNELRRQLRVSAAEAGVVARIVPHQLRHTYATSMLRAGVSLPALMRLLGHHNANMTMIYVEVTQGDLQREYQAAIARPRYLVPVPPTARAEAASACPVSLAEAIAAAIRLIDARIGSAPDGRDLALLRRRLVRIAAIAKRLGVDDEAGIQAPIGR